MAAVQSNGALYSATRVSIPVRFGQQNTNGLWKTTFGRNSVTRSQQSYHWTWLAVPVLAGLVFVLALLWLSWWALAWLAGAALLLAAKVPQAMGINGRAET
jgi:hypothetical protein